MLPSGFRVTEAGAGALCMLCHNSRNGARSDSITNFPNAYFKINSKDGFVRSVGTPHDQTAADIVAGKNMFFADPTRPYNPSKHMMVNDTCVGCHVALPGLSGSTAANAPNHTFRVDGTLCVNCHSKNVKLTTQDDYDAAMNDPTNGLSKAIGNGFMSAVTALKAGAGQVQIGSGSTAVAFSLDNISSVDGPGTTPHAANPCDSQVLLHFTTPIVYPAGGTATVSTYVASLTTLTWVANDQTGTASAGRPIFSPSGILARAIWNNTMLTRDGSAAVHNPTFVFNVISNTKAAMVAGPASSGANCASSNYAGTNCW